MPKQKPPIRIASRRAEPAAAKKPFPQAQTQFISDLAEGMANTAPRRMPESVPGAPLRFKELEVASEAETETGFRNNYPTGTEDGLCGKTSAWNSVSPSSIAS